jgi:O-antigen ligase
MKKQIFTLLSTSNIVSLIIGLLLFSLAPQAPIHERFQLLERVAAALVLLLLTLYLSRSTPKTWVIPIPITLLLFVLFISLAQMPLFNSLKDAIAFTLITIFAILVISSQKTKPVVNGVVFASILLIITTAVFMLFSPEQAFEQYGQLKGAFYGSNSLAISLVLVSPAIFAFSTTNKIVTYLIRTFLFSSTFALIWLSTSQTSLLVFISMFCGWLLFVLYKRSVKLGLSATAGATILVILTAANWEWFTSLFGKSADLSGRFPLWQAYIDAVLMKPLQGYGWHIRTTQDMPLGNLIFQQIGFPHINANNDLLNWWALTGFFGAILALLSVIYLLINGFRARNKNELALFVFLTGFVLIVSGFTELSTMHPDGWLILNLAFVVSALVIFPNTTARAEWLKTGAIRF